jgi:hypothetical protein
MSASDHLQPAQFDELAAARSRKFAAILDQVPSFDEEIDRVAEPVQPAKRPTRQRLRVVK